MAKAETVGFAIHPEDRPALDHLVEHFGGGNRSAFLREAMRVMAARERAETLKNIQRSVHISMINKFGRELTTHELDAITRASVKGRLPDDATMRTFEPQIQQLLRDSVAEYAKRTAHIPQG